MAVTREQAEKAMHVFLESVSQPPMATGLTTVWRDGAENWAVKASYVTHPGINLHSSIDGVEFIYEYEINKVKPLSFAHKI